MRNSFRNLHVHLFSSLVKLFSFLYFYCVFRYLYDEQRWIYIVKVHNHPHYFEPRDRQDFTRISESNSLRWKIRHLAIIWRKPRDPSLQRFVTIHSRYIQTEDITKIAELCNEIATFGWIACSSRWLKWEKIGDRRFGWVIGDGGMNGESFAWQRHTPIDRSRAATTVIGEPPVVEPSPRRRVRSYPELGQMSVGVHPGWCLVSTCRSFPTSSTCRRHGGAALKR